MSSVPSAIFCFPRAFSLITRIGVGGSTRCSIRESICNGLGCLPFTCTLLLTYAGRWVSNPPSRDVFLECVRESGGEGEDDRAGEGDRERGAAGERGPCNALAGGASDGKSWPCWLFQELEVRMRPGGVGALPCCNCSGGVAELGSEGEGDREVEGIKPGASSRYSSCMKSRFSMLTVDNKITHARSMSCF